MTKNEKLLGRLRDLGVNVPKNARVDRTYRGYAQKEAWAWSWGIINCDLGVAVGIGSCFTVTECLAAKQLVAKTLRDGAIEILPN